MSNSKSTETVLSVWMAESRCAMCSVELSLKGKMCNHGVCPGCGHKSKSGVVATYEVVYRLVRPGRWWQIWKKPHRQYRE